MTSQSDVDQDYDKTLCHLKKLTLGAYFNGHAKSVVT